DLEEEVAARPREEVIDRLLDLHADVARKVGGRDDPPLDEQLTDAFVGLPCLLHEYFVELLLCDLPVPHEQVAQPVTAVDDARVRDAPLVEVDLAEARAVRDGQAPGLLAECQQLADVGQAGFLEAALD